MDNPSEPNAKIVFRVPAEDGTEDVETLWAFDLGNDEYRIDNLPYFAYGVSWNDIVFAPLDDEDGRPTFQKVIEKSGNRTIRLIFEVAVEAGSTSRKLLDSLIAVGCDFEGANKKYIVVNIPPDVDLQSVTQIVTDADVEWEYADPTYDTVYSGH
jgi:hypothetical protein